MGKRGVYNAFIVVGIFLLLVFPIAAQENSHSILDEELFNETPVEETNLFQEQLPPNEVSNTSRAPIPQQEIDNTEAEPASPENMVPAEQTPGQLDIIPESDEAIKKEAGITPENPLWGVDITFDRLALAILFDREIRIRKALQFARERLLEIDVLAQNGNIEPMLKAKIEYARILGKVQRDVELLKKTDLPGEARAIVKAEWEIQLHQQFLSQVLEKINLEVQEGKITSEENVIINEVTGSLNSQMQFLQLRMKNRKEALKTKLQAEAGKTAEEAEQEIRSLEDQEGIQTEIEEKQENEKSIQLQIRIATIRTKVEILGDQAREAEVTLPSTSQLLSSMIQAQILVESGHLEQAEKIVAEGEASFQKLLQETNALIEQKPQPNNPEPLSSPSAAPSGEPIEI